MIKLTTIFTMVAALAICTGCEHTPRPLTDRDVELMSNSGYHSAYVNYPGGQQVSLSEAEYETMRSLIRSLAPIRKTRERRIESPQYSLSYHGGMDPTQIDVRMMDDDLEFSLGNFIHTGGSAEIFRSLLPDPKDD